MLTSDDMVQKVLLRCFWPALDENPPLTAAEIMSLADDTLSGEMWPSVMATSGKYYAAALDHAIVADYNRYRLPPKAYGPLVDVVLVLDDGEEVSLPEMTLQELGYSRSRLPRNRYRHFIEGDFLGLDPVPSEAGTLRIKFYRHPSKLCTVAEATLIADTLNLAANPLRIPAVAALAPVPSAGALLDVVSAGNAHQLLLDGAELDTITGSTNYNFASGTVLDGSGIMAGDWLTPAGFTPVVQIPDYMEGEFVRRVAAAALEAADDAEAADRELRASRRLEDRATSVGVPRSEAEPQVSRPRNSPHRLMR